MTTKIILIGFAVLSLNAFASNDDQQQQVANQRLETDVVKHREDLATHLGLEDQDALFATPRDFRSAGLNDLSLDPLPPEKSKD